MSLKARSGPKGKSPAAAPVPSFSKPAGKAAPQKRKRAAEPEPESDEDDDDLDALLDEAAAEGAQGESDAEEDDDEELDIDPAEIAAMAHLYGRPSASNGGGDDDDDDMDDGDAQLDGESSEDDGEEAADEGTGRIARPAKKPKKTVFLNNKAALEDKLGDIRLPADWPWIETLSVTTGKSFLDATENAADAVHDDLKREAAFYELSLQAASEGLHRLTDLSIPFRIPVDFFAERVKPDKHMSRIKDKLIEEKRKMESVADRKKGKEERRFAKQVQSNKLQEKSAEKKAALEQAGKLRKQNKADGKELSVERSILPGISEHLAANRADDAAKKEKKNFKREAKDKKYGHGGKKRNIRKNSSESAHGGKDYDLGKMRGNFSGFKDSKPGSFSSRSSSTKSDRPTNKNGSHFTQGRNTGAAGGSGRGGRGGRGGGTGGRGGRGGGGAGRGKPSRPGKQARSQSRK